MGTMAEEVTSWLTVDQAAAQLGLAERTLRNWMATGQIEYYAIGSKALRIKQSVVDEILERGRKPALRVGVPIRPTSFPKKKERVAA